MKRPAFLFLVVILFAFEAGAVERITVGEPIIIVSKKDLMFDKPVYLLSKIKSGSVYKYTLTIYEPGNYTIKVGEKLYDIEVVSVLKGGEELQEIIGPLSIRGNPRWFLLRLGVVVLLIIISIGGYLLARRREIRELTPEEEFEVLLGEAGKSISGENLDDFYTLLSLSIRKYLYRTFNLPALSMTSGELRMKVEEWIADIIKRSELVRFGGLSVDKKTAMDDLELAVNYLKKRKNEISAA